MTFERTPMKLDRKHHAIIDALERADHPLTVAAIASELDVGVAATRSRIRFLETHGYVERDRSGRVTRYTLGDRGRSE